MLEMGNCDDSKLGVYDGGISDIYGDDTQPKRKGRKKKGAAAGEPSVRSAVPDENDELITALINNEEVDGDALDKAFSHYSPNVDLCCDTTGTINRLRTRLPQIDDVEADENDDGQTEAGFVIKWCNRMMKKEEYTEDEKNAFDTIRELIARLGMDEE